MKKFICVCLSGMMLASVVTGQSMFKNLKSAVDSAKSAVDSAKEATETTKKIVGSSKKRVEAEVEKPKPSADEIIPIDNEKAFYIYMNLSGTKMTEDLYIDYVKVEEGRIYDTYINDEFEWQDKLAEQKKLCDERIENADSDTTFTIMANVDFGDYDFQNEGYGVIIKEGTFFPLGSRRHEKNHWVSISRGSVFGKEIALGLKDFTKYNFFAMPKDAAKTFLQSRKRYDGSINRSVAAIIKFEIDSFNSKDYKEWEAVAASNDYLPLLGIIKSIEVYDRGNGNFTKLGDLIIK